MVLFQVHICAVLIFYRQQHDIVLAQQAENGRNE